MSARKPAFRPQVESLEAREVPAFGVGGFVATDFTHTLSEAAEAVVVQADGKIVAAGVHGLARYNPDGSPDVTFNAGGPQPGVIQNTDYLNDVVIQSDGKILAAGYTVVNGRQLALLLRFNANGTPDITFGTNGRFTTDFKKGPDADNLREVALQSNGMIVAAGMVNGTWGVARFKANGSFDTSFDKDGWLTTDFGTGLPQQAYSVAVDANGRIVVGGDVRRNGDNYRDAAVVRYLGNGALDASFGGTGKVLVDFSPEFGPGFTTGEYLTHLAIQPDGRIVFTGYCTTPYHTGLFGRLNANGSLDATFGGDGRVVVALPPYTNPNRISFHIQFQELAIQPDGKIVAFSPSTSTTDFPSVVARVNTDGTLDTSFSDDGVVLFSWSGGNAHDGSDLGGLAIQPADGKIIVVGSHIQIGSTTRYFDLARFNPDGTLDA